MSRTRRTFDDGYKAKVVLEALKKKQTLEVLAKRFELLPTQISAWKAEATKNIAVVFNFEKLVEKNRNEIPAEKFFGRIGELTLEMQSIRKYL